jgi:hypothetical protein
MPALLTPPPPPTPLPPPLLTHSAALLKPFEDAATLANPKAAAASDVQQLAFCAALAAALPFRRADEPLTVVHATNAVGGWL